MPCKCQGGESWRRKVPLMSDAELKHQLERAWADKKSRKGVISKYARVGAYHDWCNFRRVTLLEARRRGFHDEVKKALGS